MKVYKRLIKPIMLVPKSANDYSLKEVPIEPEEKWYPEENRETLVQKYKHLETTFKKLAFDNKYEEVEIPDENQTPHKETFWDSLSEEELMEPMRHFKD